MVHGFKESLSNQMTKNRAVLAGLGVLLAARLLLQIQLFQHGLIALTADQFGRIFTAASWAAKPYGWWSGPWLPFLSYLLGIALRVKYDLVMTPRILSVAVGLISVVLMYGVTYQASRSRTAGFISAILLAVNPAHLWISAGPLTEGYHAALILGATLCLIYYLDQQRRRYLFGCAALLFVANGIRFEAWWVTLIFSIFLILHFWQSYRNTRQLTGLWSLLLAQVILWLFPLVWITGSTIQTGNPMGFLSWIQQYKTGVYGTGSNTLLNYLPVVLTIDPFAIAFFLPGLVFTAIQARRSVAARLLLVMALVPLGLFFILHKGQLEPEGNYIRYLSAYIFFTYPLTAYLMAWVIRKISWKPFLSYGFAGIFLCIVCFVQIRSAYAFKNDPSAEGLPIGQRIKALRNANPGLRGQPVLIEVSYWQYYAMQIGANDIANVYYDRPVDHSGQVRDAPSWLLKDPEMVKRCLVEMNFSYVVVQSPVLVNVLQNEFGLVPKRQVKGYTFFKVSPDQLKVSAQSSPCRLISGVRN